MRKTLLFFTLLVAFSTVASAQVSFGKASLFDDGWQFSQDSTSWRTLNLPHDWSIEGLASPSLASCTGYLPGGIGWYLKHFSWTPVDGEKAWVYFEGVYNRSTVWLNGHEIGGRPNGYVSFMCELTPWLVEGDNVLCVKADHSRSADSRWYTGSGIYRDVWFVTAPETHLGQWGTSYQLVKLSSSKAELSVGWSLVKGPHEEGKLEVRIALIDPSGKCVASAKKAVKAELSGSTSSKGGGQCSAVQAELSGSTSLKVADPQLWSIDNPVLYTLRTELWRDGVKIDGNSIKAGLRDIRFDADKGFFLNGENMKIKGVCLHHDFGVLGSVVPKDSWERRLLALKSMGVNAIRLSHNPQAPVLYDLCDSLGLMIMDEISDEWEFPKRKWLEGWNVGTPGYQGTYDFFEQWIEKDLEAMIMRDRCHPSVILWSIGNEVDYPNDPYSHPILNGSSISQPMYGGYDPKAPSAMRIGEIAKRLAPIARSIDPSRPVTGALAGVVMSNETEYPAAVDIVGYNYTEDRYDTDHAKYPGRIIYGSENRHSYQDWKAVKDRDFISGQFLWTGADYLGESYAWPSRGMGSGLLGFGSFRKPRGWFRASLWSEEPVTYIGTYPTPEGKRAGMLSIDAWDDWNYTSGQKIRVVCYTNAPYARLLLNGKTVGVKKAFDQNTGIISWDIPYQSGALRAEGLSEGGTVLSSYQINTPMRPYSLMVSSDKTSLKEKGSVAHLTVEVLDEKGNLVNIADNDITCTVTGPAKLLGLENSDNTDMSDIRDNHHRAFRGRILAYIAGTGEPGPITVTFSSPLLKGCEYVLNSDCARAYMVRDEAPLLIRKVDCGPSPDCREVPFILDANGIGYQPMLCANWNEQYPYHPQVKFRIAHTGTSILLQFQVSEKDIAAIRDHDTDYVWNDTCVEFFVSPDCNDTYYNIECNGAGYIWLAGGTYGKQRPLADTSIISGVKRLSSLGSEPFPLRKGDVTWTLVEVIPVETFFRHHITSLDGMKMTANFYKCGDELPNQHYTSWKPIHTPKSRFHSPEFFGNIIFE